MCVCEDAVVEDCDCVRYLNAQYICVSVNMFACRDVPPTTGLVRAIGMIGQ